jgi:hypothetical protein
MSEEKYKNLETELQKDPLHENAAAILKRRLEQHDRQDFNQMTFDKVGFRENIKN